MRPFLASSARKGHSDLSMPRLGLNGLLHRLFASEGRWLRRRNLLIGVSLLCLAHPAGDPDGE